MVPSARVIEQKSAVIIYLAAEARNHGSAFVRDERLVVNLCVISLKVCRLSHVNVMPAVR